MLNSEENKFCSLSDKKNIRTFVLSEKKILNEKKNITPLQVKWSVPYYVVIVVFFCGGF